jgi:hypothetical protein
MTIPTGVPWSYRVPFETFFDAEYGAMTYSLSVNPYSAIGLAIHATTRVMTVTPGATDYDNAGRDVTVMATDPWGATATDVFKLIVDRPPYVAATFNLVDQPLWQVGHAITEISTSVLNRPFNDGNNVACTS